jgi:PKD repeat protein
LSIFRGHRSRYILSVSLVILGLALALLVFRVPNSQSPNSVAPHPLIASFIFSPSAPQANQTVSFTGSASGGTSPYRYSWSFGDGSGGVGLSATHNFTLAGSFTVVLRLSDSGSPQQSATSQQTVTIAAASHAPPQSFPVIKISYSSTLNSTLKPSGIQPSNSANTFLVIHLTVENNGYLNFTADPFRDMYVKVGGSTYNVSADYVVPGVGDAGFPLSITLNNTQSASGDVVFEVPIGSTSFTPGWRLLAGEQIRFDWAPIS